MVVTLWEWSGPQVSESLSWGWGGVGALEEKWGWVCLSGPCSPLSVCVSDKPVPEESEGPGSPPPYKMIQTIGLSVGAAVAYIIAVLGLMFYCKKRCKAKRLQKQPEGEEPEMECLNGEGPWEGGPVCARVLSAPAWPRRRALRR